MQHKQGDEMKRYLLLLWLSLGWLLFVPGHVVAGMPETTNPDHLEGLTGPFPDGISVTRACLECHEDQGEEMLSSAHWRWKGPTPYLVGHENENELGKTNLINNY